MIQESYFFLTEEKSENFKICLHTFPLGSDVFIYSESRAVCRCYNYASLTTDNMNE